MNEKILNVGELAIQAGCMFCLKAFFALGRIEIPT
jgi:hypothetical protein